MQKASYRMTGVSVKKVLVGRYKDLKDVNLPEFEGSLPFDAHVYSMLKNHKNQSLLRNK